MTMPTTKIELLNTMQESYRAFEALLAPLTPQLLTTPGVNGDWSIKDILVHIAAWQERTSRQLRARATGQPDPLLPIENEAQMDAFNEETFQANRQRPLAEVQTELRTAVQNLQASVEAVSEEELFLARANREPLWQVVAGNSFEHYDEHMDMITAWLQQRA